MKRREFITLLAGVAAARPMVARAQQPAMPVVGFLSSASARPFTQFVMAFSEGLKELGYVDGQNVAVEYRWAEDRYDRLPVLAAELVRHPVAVIVASGGPVSALAAKGATTTIPIVFTAVSDPIGSGLVESMNRPGGNATGVAALTIELDAKRLELLREIAPAAASIAALVNPHRPDVQTQLTGMQAAAQSVGLNLLIVKAGDERELDASFEMKGQQKFDSLLVGADPFFNNRREQLLALLARHGKPAIFAQREFVLAGGLASYGTSLSDAYRQAGVYAGRILRGEKPSNLPVVQPVKFETAINLKTARALGLDVPPALVARADEVIE
jgi:putative tryptophan/tyrosine transport system substrate-binding protein